MRPGALNARSTYNFMQPSRDLRRPMNWAAPASTLVCGQCETLTGQSAQALICPPPRSWWNPLCCRTTTVCRLS